MCSLKCLIIHIELQLISQNFNSAVMLAYLRTCVKCHIIHVLTSCEKLLQTEKLPRRFEAKRFLIDFIWIVMIWWTWKWKTSLPQRNYWLHSIQLDSIHLCVCVRTVYTCSPRQSTIDYKRIYEIYIKQYVIYSNLGSECDFDITIERLSHQFDLKYFETQLKRLVEIFIISSNHFVQLKTKSRRKQLSV